MDDASEDSQEETTTQQRIVYKTLRGEEYCFPKDCQSGSGIPFTVFKKGRQEIIVIRRNWSESF